VVDARLATIVHGAIRGNHYPLAPREAILVLYTDCWTLRHDAGEGAQSQKRAFEGAGAALLEVDPLCAHAIENTGNCELL
jgi:hypothetical protein